MGKKGGINRLTISLPTIVSNSLQDIRRKLGNVSASAAVRVTIREYLADHIMEDKEGWRIGTILSMYSPSQSGHVINRTTIKSQFRKLIHADTQVPLGDQHIYEVIVVKGLSKEIQKLISPTP